QPGSYAPPEQRAQPSVWRLSWHHQQARKYQGNRHIVRLEEFVADLVKELFGARHADLRPLSGHVAGEAVIMGLCKPGDTVLELDAVGGGHRLAEKLTCASLID